MLLPIDDVNKLIRTRRSIFPNMYSDKPIADETIEMILENANWAPNHKKTEPWRFAIIKNQGLEGLKSFMHTWYEQNTPPDKFSQTKYDKIGRKIDQSSCIIAIIMQRDPDERVPEWEEIAAVSCAVQNMWLTCTALGIGSYWSSPKSIISDPSFLDLEEGQRCLGLFYMGYSKAPELPASRSPISDKIVWITT